MVFVDEMDWIRSDLWQQHFEKGKANHCSEEDGFGLADLNQALTILESMQSSEVNQSGTKKNALGIALTHFWIGRSYFCQEDFDASIISLRIATTIQEALVGRYHQSTGDSYLWLGESYFYMGDRYHQLSLGLARTSHRIQVYLYGRFFGLSEYSANEVVAKRLEESGLDDCDIHEHFEAMLVSIRHEKNGDDYRLDGYLDKAMDSYRRAAEFEDFNGGTQNPNLSFIWRKIALMVALKNHGNGFKDGKNSDFIWMSDQKVHENACHNPEACKAVQAGDNLHRSNDYAAATFQYRKAIHLSSDAAKTRHGSLGSSMDANSFVLSGIVGLVILLLWRAFVTSKRRKAKIVLEKLRALELAKTKCQANDPKSSGHKGIRSDNQINNKQEEVDGGYIKVEPCPEKKKEV